MTLSSTVVNDLVAGTSTLTVVHPTGIESIVYSNSTGILTFAAEVTFTLSPADYLKFAAILIAFNLGIISVYDQTQLNFSTFNVQSAVDTNDGVNQLHFSFQNSANSVYSMTATYPAGNIVFARRLFIQNLTFEEWTAFLLFHVHYTKEVRKQFNL